MSSEFRSLDMETSNVPVWCELGIQDSTLLLRVPIEAQAYLEAQLRAPGEFRAVQFLTEACNADSFIPPRGGAWGFDGALSQGDETDGWIEHSAPLPTPSQSAKTWSRRRKLSASLQIPCMLLDLTGVETTTNRAQLMLVEMEIARAREPHGAPISAKFSQQFCRWVAHILGDQEGIYDYEPVSDAMKKAFAHMCESTPYMDQRFQAQLRSPGRIDLTCPGDRTSLNPTYAPSDSSGYEIHPHNVDDTLQQLTLLAGLAKLHELARADGF